MQLPFFPGLDKNPVVFVVAESFSFYTFFALLGGGFKDFFIFTPT